MNLFIDRYQQHRLKETQGMNQPTTPPAHAAHYDLDDLMRRTEALTLASQALWEIVQAKLDLRDEEILRKMQEIDLRDGALDGRLTSSLVKCPSCHRGNRGARQFCLYCGARLPASSGAGAA